MVGWRSRVWKEFNLHERQVGGPHRLYTPISRRRTAYYWRLAAQKYASGLGKFALRSTGYFGAAAALAEASYSGYKYLKENGMFNQTERRQTGSHTRKRRAVDPYGYHAAAPNFDRGTTTNRSTVWNTTTMPDRGGAGVLRHYRKKTGRYKSFGKKAISLLRSQVMPQIESWRDLTNGYDAGGSKVLTCAKADAAGDATFPVHLYELNNLNNKQSGMLSLFGAGCWRLRRRDADGVFYLEPFSRQNNDNSAATFCWDIEHRNAANADNVTPFAYLDWVDIRLLISGPRKYPATVKVQLIRFLEEDCCPGVYGTAATGTAPTASTSRSDPLTGLGLPEWNNMWLEYTAPLITNPISTRANYNNGKKFQVIKSCRFDFQPRDTSDDGPTGGVGDVKVLKWFNRVNKNFRFTEVAEPVAQIDADETMIAQEGFNTQVPLYQLSPHNKARLFLMISATAPVVDTTAAPANALDSFVSYDINLRRKWWFNENP